MGAVALALPTLFTLARDFWPDEQGTHGPIILTTGSWLLYRERKRIIDAAEPGDPRLAGIVLAGSLCVYIFARITSMLGIEALGLYGALLAIFYYHVGLRAIRTMWFPLIYLLLMFPMPETLILPLSRVLKLALSDSAVGLLSALGYRVGRGGVTIFVDQYELLVADACSGLHSLIGLTAIGIFFCYIRYLGNWRKSLPLLLLIPPIAILSNFVRVVFLILITHHFGDRVAQTYLHDFAAIFVYAIALLALFCAAWALQAMRQRWGVRS